MCARRLGDRWESDDEGGACSSALALGRHDAAVKVDEPLYEGQADAEPAGRAVRRGLALKEQVEDAREIVRLDSPAVVGDLEHRLGRFTRDAHADVPAGAGVGRGVDEQVGEDLLHARLVALDPHR